MIKKNRPRNLLGLKIGINLVDKIGCCCWYVQPVTTSHNTHHRDFWQSCLNSTLNNNNNLLHLNSAFLGTQSVYIEGGISSTTTKRLFKIDQSNATLFRFSKVNDECNKNRSAGVKKSHYLYYILYWNPGTQREPTRRFSVSLVR